MNWDAEDTSTMLALVGNFLTTTQAPSSPPLLPSTVSQHIKPRFDKKRNEGHDRTNYPALTDFLCQSILGAVTGLFFALADPRGE